MSNDSLTDTEFSEMENAHLLWLAATGYRQRGDTYRARALALATKLKFARLNDKLATMTINDIAGVCRTRWAECAAERARADRLAAVLRKARAHIVWLHSCIEDEVLASDARIQDAVLAQIDAALAAPVA